MSRDQQGNILQYCSNNCLLVINSRGKIRELYTPFLVTAINSIGQRKRTYIVDEVMNSSQGELAYKINGAMYHYAQFTISINF